ncbi:pyridoxamine 5'-phosphate oxidase family protein [Methylopila musalis]|uniref:Pyridoxamine 5'-phosphate oxidase family protein n=1 Tax=Methylopila musalis TaxID=1134781 RepID=A0ABW3Z7Y4_9HYPH
MTAPDAARVWDLVDDIGVCMLTSKDGDALRARPMHAMPDRDEGAIAFFTDARAHKDDEIAAEPSVCLAFAKPNSNAYVSLSGEATVSSDRAEIERHWSEMAKTWFPDGPSDPNLRLLTVRPQSAEYWDGKSNPVVVAFEIAKARYNHERPDLGDNAKVSLT